MAARERRKLKLLADTINGDERKATDDEGSSKLQTGPDLPVELLELIISRLTLDDNIRASAVCRRWNKVAISVRVVNQSPWLMYFPEYGNLYEFYDPSERKTYSFDLPELYGSRACHSKDGWLLLYRPRNHSIFFFNPFIRETINLPRFELTYQMAAFQLVAFSCAPTSAGCVVFTIKHISLTVLAVSTCHPGASKWTTVNHQNRLPSVNRIWNKIIFCAGMFYCLSLTGWLGVYDPAGRTWNVLDVPPPRCPENFLAKKSWKGKFMAEHHGGILVIYTCRTENPVIFKLNHSEMAWEEMRSLNGETLFASILSSHSRSGLMGTMRNVVYFSKVHSFGKRCISYSLDDSKYYPCKQSNDWGEQNPFENIWIEPPRINPSFEEQ